MRLRASLFALAFVALARAASGVDAATPSPTPSPSSSATALDPVSPLAVACRTSNAAARFAESYRYCFAAADAFRRGGLANASDFASYRNSAEMFSFAASDQIGLGRNAEALQTAYAAHRLLYYIDTPDRSAAERDDIVRLARSLRRIERTAQSNVSRLGASSRASAVPAGSASAKP